MKKITISAITSIASVTLMAVGLCIVMVPPMIIEALYSYYPDHETIIDDATNSPFIVSLLPTLSSVLLIVGLIGLGVLGTMRSVKLA